MVFLKKYRFLRLSAIVAIFCIMMTIAAVSAAEEASGNPMNMDRMNDTAFIMNRTIEMIDKSAESLESMKSDANETTIGSINDYLDELEAIRSNVKNANSIEELTTQKISLDELFIAMNEELGLELQMNEDRPEMSGMENQTRNRPSQMSEIGNQSDGQNPMKDNDPGMREDDEKKTEEMEGSPDDPGILSKIRGFFESLFS